MKFGRFCVACWTRAKLMLSLIASVLQTARSIMRRREPSCRSVGRSRLSRSFCLVLDRRRSIPVQESLN